MEEDEDEQSGDMPIVFLCIFRFVRLLMSGHGVVAMENAALRLQLAAFRRERKRPVLTSFDRLFWVGLSLIWNGWRAALSYVQPDTVIAAIDTCKALAGLQTTTWHERFTENNG